MATIEEIRQQTQTARQVLEQKKQETQQIESQLQEQNKSLPNVQTQRALRGQYGEGLQGRNFRRQVAQASQEIENKQGEVESYKQGLSEYEGQVQEAESQIADYDKRVYAQKIAQKYYDQNVPLAFARDDNNPYIYDYLRAMYNNEGNYYYSNSLNEAVTQYNQGVPLNDAFKKFNVDQLVKSGVLKFDESNNQQAITQAKDFYNDRLMRILNLNTRNLPRSESVKITTQKGNKIGLVSAQSLISGSAVNENGLVSDRVRIGLSGGQGGESSSGQLNRNRIGSIFAGRSAGREEGFEGNQSQPYQGEVHKAPSLGKQFKSQIGELGFIKGSLSFLGNKGVRLVEAQQTKAMRAGKTLYQPEGIQNIVRESIQTAPYTVPVVGQGLMIAGGVESAIRSPTIMGKVLGLVEAGLGTVGLNKQVIYLKTPERVYVPSAYNPPTPKSVSLDISPNENQFIFKEKVVVPRRWQYVNSPIRQFLRKPPIRKLYSPKATYQVESFGGVKVNQEGDILQPSFIKVSRKGGKRVDIYNLKGGARLTDVSVTKPTDISSKKQFNKLFSSDIYATREGQELFFGSIEAEKLSKVKFSRGRNFVGADIKLIPKGRRTIRSDILGIQQKVASGDEGSTYAYKFVNRDTTFPTQIPRRFPATKGLSFVKETPNNFGGDTNNIFTKLEQKVRPKKINANILQKGISQTIGKALKPITKPLQKVEKGFFNANPFSSVSAKTETSNQVPSVTAMVVSDRNTQSTKSQTAQKDIFGLSQKESQRTNQTQNNAFLNLDKVATTPRTNFNQKTNVKKVSGLRDILSLRSGQSSNLGLKQISKLRTPVRNKTPNRIREPFGAPFPTPKTTYSQKGGKVVKVSEGRYVIFVKRYGQDTIIGEASTLEEAKRILKQNLSQTLSASGYITSKSSGERQKVNDLFGSMFAPSKKDIFRLIQKRGKRLSSQSEIFGIQAARKNKTRQTSWFGKSFNSPNRRKGTKRSQKLKWW